MCEQIWIFTKKNRVGKNQQIEEIFRHNVNQFIYLRTNQ